MQSESYSTKSYSANWSTYILAFQITGYSALEACSRRFLYYKILKFIQIGEDYLLQSTHN